MTRSLRLMVLTGFALFALNDTARTMTGGLLNEAYSLVTSEEIPLPLERPALLGLAGLGKCLHGTGHVNGDDVYASFCADLAAFADPAPTPLSNDIALEETAPVEFASFAIPLARIAREAPAQTAQAHATPERMTGCFIDRQGAVNHRSGGEWVSAAPAVVHTADENSPKQESNRIVAVPENCIVQSPADAKILYAGFFKGYLGIVILETSEGERLTVAGLGRIAVERNRKIATGMTIGTTSKVMAPALADAAGREGAALLYIAGSDTMVPAS